MPDFASSRTVPYLGRRHIVGAFFAWKSIDYLEFLNFPKYFIHCFC